ncbi:MAG: SDR family oxidoreductase [Actinobacteria bacterium]|nr:SDR family oxidoreductase [Actinomycetota bacterium]
MNVVIGGNSGIGAAVVELLAGSTLVVDRTGTDVACDITDRASVDAVAALVQQGGGLDALIVTAGVSPSMGDARTILNVDLFGMVNVLEAFEPLAREGSVAVCVASIAGHVMDWPAETLDLLDTATDLDALTALAENSSMAYVLAKTGVIRQVRRRAKAWGSRGARIVSVSPGVTDTPMGRAEMAADNGTDLMAAASALGRQAEPEELASVIAFLASPGASYITGTDLLVDGGSLAGFGR